jgi:hypothetical protein
MAQIRVYIPHQTLVALNRRAASAGITLSEVVRLTLRAGLSGRRGDVLPAAPDAEAAPLEAAPAA